MCFNLVIYCCVDLNVCDILWRLKYNAFSDAVMFFFTCSNGQETSSSTAEEDVIVDVTYAQIKKP